MDKRIIYTRTDGGVSVVIPMDADRRQVEAEPARDATPDKPAAPAVMRPETDEEFLKRVANRAVPAGTQYRVVNAGDVPTDRTFRDAWQDSYGKLTVDMAKAREIHRDRLRAQRVDKLEALDIEYTKADAAGNVVLKASIEKKRQELRDVTADPAIAAAATPDQLKSVIPAALR